MRIAILTPNEGPIARTAATAKAVLEAKGNNVDLIGHRPERLADTFLRRTKKVGLWLALDEIAYCYYEQWSTPWDHAVSQLNLRETPVFDQQINSTRAEELGSFLERISPNLLVVMGASMIDVRLIPASTIAVNVHPGILPQYKGVGNPAAIVCRDASFVGYTVHRLTSRLDEGEYLLRKRLDAPPQFNAPLLYLLAYEAAIKKLACCLDDILLKPWPLEDDFSNEQPEQILPLWRLPLSKVLRYKLRHILEHR